MHTSAISLSHAQAAKAAEEAAAAKAAEEAAPAKAEKERLADEAEAKAAEEAAAAAKAEEERLAAEAAAQMRRSASRELAVAVKSPQSIRVIALSVLILAFTLIFSSTARRMAPGAKQWVSSGSSGDSKSDASVETLPPPEGLSLACAISPKLSVALSAGHLLSHDTGVPWSSLVT